MHEGSTRSREAVGGCGTVRDVVEAGLNEAALARQGLWELNWAVEPNDAGGDGADGSNVRGREGSARWAERTGTNVTEQGISGALWHR